MRTYLEMLSPDNLNPAACPAALLEVRELDNGSSLIRATTLGIGRAHQWPSSRWDEGQWDVYLSRPHLRHWVGLVHGVPAGLLSLDVPPSGDVEIDSFGLLPAHIGHEIGGHFLTVSVRTAWAAAPYVSRVWLHTSSKDHPHALPNYERRGFRRYDPADYSAGG